MLKLILAPSIYEKSHSVYEQSGFVRVLKTC